MRSWCSPAGRLVRARGVTMVEGAIGICVLLVATLIGVQLVLLLHAKTAAQGAANRTARAYTISGGAAEAFAPVYEGQRRGALAALQWDGPACNWEMAAGERVAGVCLVTVTVPVVVPGGSLLGDMGLHGPLQVQATGRYPYGEDSGI